MPIHATRVIATPRRCAIRAAHTGCVATRAVEDATVVNRRLGIHVAKCAPSSSPDSAMSRHCAPVSARTSARWRAATSTAVSPEPSAVRQNAIASAGAAHAAINGPDVEIATTATASSARSVPGGGTGSPARMGVLTRRTLRPPPGGAPTATATRRPSTDPRPRPHQRPCGVWWKLPDGLPSSARIRAWMAVIDGTDNPGSSIPPHQLKGRWRRGCPPADPPAAVASAM